MACVASIGAAPGRSRPVPIRLLYLLAWNPAGLRVGFRLPSVTRLVQRACGYGKFGNAGVGIITGPGLVNFDMGLMKDFVLTEKKRLQFRSEFFNVFNHTNLGNPTTTVGNGNYGRITSALDARILEFSLRFHF